MTSEGVELVPLHLLTPHFLTLSIRLSSVAPPFIGVAGMVVVDPKAIVTGTEDTAKTEGQVGNGGIGSRTRWCR